MNKIFLTALLAALMTPLSASAGAVNGSESGFEQNHGHKIAMMAQELGLTADQQSKVDTIFKEQHEKFKAIHEETNSRLQAVLSPEQMKKLDDIHARHPGMANHPQKSK